jgi:hypothetical protein
MLGSRGKQISQDLPSITVEKSVILNEVSGSELAIHVVKLVKE